MTFSVKSNFECANVCGSEVNKTEDGWEVSFASHPHGGPEALWFYFRIDREGQASEGEKIRLLWRHFNNVLGGSTPETVAPVVKYDDEGFKRLGLGRLVAAEDGRHHAEWKIDAPRESLYVAFCFPYGPAEVKKLVSDTNGFFTAEEIGVSQQGRPITMLYNSPGSKKKERPGLFLLSRQHSGETSGSWVLDGTLRRLAEEGDNAPVTWVVPLANIDGVVQGDYGKDNFPYDLNRAWGRPPMRHEVMVIQAAVGRLRQRSRLLLGLDFHSPGACDNHGVFLFMPKPAEFPAQAEIAGKWAEAFRLKLTDEYAATQFQRVASYPSRWETYNFSQFCCHYDFCGITVENPYSMCGEKVLAIEDYREIGARIAEGVLEKINQGQVES